MATTTIFQEENIKMIASRRERQEEKRNEEKRKEEKHQEEKHHRRFFLHAYK